MELQSVHTRVLLNRLHKMQIMESEWLKNGSLPIPDSCGDPYCEFASATPASVAKEKAALKAELATREHIPNKQEAKTLRQQKAWAKKHR